MSAIDLQQNLFYKDCLNQNKKMDNKFSLDLFTQIPLIGIIRGFDQNQTTHILEQFLSAGLTTIEITLNTPNALEIIKKSSENFGGKLNVGAGTVCTMDDLKKALDAGAQFIVTPIFDSEIITFCKENGVPVFPGAFSPTEIYQAWSLGATMVKVFPGGLLGAQYIKEVKGPLQEIKLLPTGGVGLSNIEEFIRAGADGFGLGGALIDKILVENEDWKGLKSHFEKFVAKLK